MQVGQHLLVSRLLKRIYNLWLPQPSYPATWDADKVVNPCDNGALPFKLLKRKLAMLMVLVEPNRVSEFQALDLRYRLYHPKGVAFIMPAGVPPQQVMFVIFPRG